MNLFDEVEESEPFKLYFNIGAGFDIPTCIIYKGKHGESILNGGYSLFNGFAGKPNTFKSSIADWCELAAMDRVVYGTNQIPSCLKYDTEMNKNVEHLKDFCINLPMLSKDEFNPFIQKKIIITDKSKYTGDKFFTILKTSLNKKLENKKDFTVITPFLDEKNELYKTIYPSFGMIDTLSEFDTENERAMGESNELGDSGANTLFMKSGLYKTRFLMELAPYIHKTSHYTTMIVQVGKEVSIQTGPVPPPPSKTLAAMNSGEVFKNVTAKFSFLTLIVYQSINAKALYNGSRMEDGPLYPIDKPSKDASGKPFKIKNDNDLFEVQLKCLRNKNGPTGFINTVLISQSEGVLRDLTEFHYIKERRFGLEGNLQTYHTVFLPDISIGRTTIRRKLKESYPLRRAINILSELLQFKDLKPIVLAKENLDCTPEELYNDLKNKGYDWNVLLNTRGWYTFNNDDPKLIPYLSIIDLLRMRKDLYFPYWMDPDTKQLKKEYQNFKEYL